MDADPAIGRPRSLLLMFVLFIGIAGENKTPNQPLGVLCARLHHAQRNLL